MWLHKGFSVGCYEVFHGGFVMGSIFRIKGCYRGPKVVYLLGLYKGSTTCEVSILKRYGNLVGGS